MSLAEIQETARTQNLDWLSLASDFAQRMLLEVFRPDDPVLQVVMPPENRQELEEQLAQLPAEIFTAQDSLGWVYQFWQRDEKERVNKSEMKIGADGLSPATQLFTEDYMVLFVLHNTLGAWWAAKRRTEGKDHHLSGYDWTYLRLLEDGSPAAGSFAGWPRTAGQLRILDPCMGSGHFLVFALPILVFMRREEEGSTLTEAVCSVLAENLFGLELDARCSQIAAFNLALTAWRMVGRPIQLPEMHLACSGLGINASQDSWIALADDRGLARDTLAELYTTFQKAPTLGSLIDPTRVGRPLLIARFKEVWPLLERALAAEQQSLESRELAIAAQGVLAAVRILTGKFTLVATNVPYLGRGKQHDDLRQYCEEFYSDAKADLATCFVERSLRFCADGCSVALVTPQNWLAQPGYRRFRETLLREQQWDFLAWLGPNAFQDMNWWAATTALIGFTNAVAGKGHSIVGWDISNAKRPADKVVSLRSAPTQAGLQTNQLTNPGSIVAFETQQCATSLGDFACVHYGSKPGQTSRVTVFFWEVDNVDTRWMPMESSPSGNEHYSGKAELCLSLDEISRQKVDGFGIRGAEAWGHSGVIIAKMRHLPSALYLGQFFDHNTFAIIPKSPDHLGAVYEFIRQGEFQRLIRKLNQKSDITCELSEAIPFDFVRWQAIAEHQYAGGLPRPHSSNPTQWLFSGLPNQSDHPLQVAVARLLGYRWPRQTGSDFPDCPALGPDGLEHHADVDGIVCLQSLSGEPPAADRLRALLADAYAPQWSAAKLAKLIGNSDSLEIWLRDNFFEEHCTLFHNRPFVWHIWDGRKDGFHALVNYHRLAGPNDQGRKTLEKLIYTSLGDWISRQRAEVASGADGSEARLSAAVQLQSELKNILLGERPYDVFVRWKPIHEQAIGWEPDLNDGVRLNLRPWLMAKPYQASKKDSCILRVPPIRLPLGKDRGKEPHRDKTDFPWFAETDERNNDIHLTLDEKQRARERKKE
jgi:hypothetical protein